MYTVLYLLSLAQPTLSLWPSAYDKDTRSGATVDSDLAPRPTDAPLQRRQGTVTEHIPDNVCGWFQGGDYSDSYTLSPSCHWNSDKKIVGDDRYTDCLGFYVATASLPSDFLTCSDPNNAYCVSFVYPSGYSGFGCATRDAPLTPTMEMTWSGMDTAIAFPTYTGRNGASIGTQLPMKTTTETGHLSGTSSNDPSGSNSKSPTPVGAIVGGVIGGLAVVGIVVALVVFMVIRASRRKRDNPPVPPNGPQQPVIEQHIPALNPEDGKEAALVSYSTPQQDATPPFIQQQNQPPPPHPLPQQPELHSQAVPPGLHDQYIYEAPQSNVAPAQPSQPQQQQQQFIASSLTAGHANIYEAP
ncbi:hypothetical protein P152DRAFT_463015 [Eremomyces bilateralis CBS 781.70]|uniref:Mid2 domain-containing protein n=1 Tax=Eremomyces bilateralis CBS 781.70 TaxID=1392243 RepID=A0A6G1FQ87_9PEZI|nr:uncharacterized protein P152DRAFT_463015 [Eremomyces bilateralis CBS 781.70]KAF1807957.1 hypothetical protein P152DRAFT_463015 [Eremomyces bilateralis CBS 781.70]